MGIAWVGCGSPAFPSRHHARRLRDMHPTPTLRQRVVRGWRSARARHPGWAVGSTADGQVRDLVSQTDWTRFALTVTDPVYLELAARAMALGGIACHPFANFYVFSARPADSIVHYVNLVKGRPPTQTGSVVTTPERIAGQFDWDKLPLGLDRERVQAFIQRLVELGPIGFRGPARNQLPSILTADDGGVRTVQVVSPGTACPSNRLYARVLDQIPEDYLYGTSANRSRQITGAEDEPVHYRLAPLQADFGRTAGFLMVGAADDGAIQHRYPLHAPMSATLVSFHKLGPRDRSGSLPRLVVERYGSLALDTLRAVAAETGLGLWLAPTARRRLTQRDYAADRAPAIAEGLARAA